MNLGLKNPEIECLLTKWHHGMLLRMVARIITLGTQNMARLLGDSLEDTYGHNKLQHICRGNEVAQLDD